MSLWVVLESGKDYEYHIGNDLSQYEFNHIKFVQADGPELNRAIAITGLPKGFKRFEQKFPQPWANLIVLNWT